MSNARQRKAREARKQAKRAVDRGERIKPTPETVAKLMPHPLELLLDRGREGGGIDADQLQCCEEIADAAQAVAPGLGIASVDLVDADMHLGGLRDHVLSPRQERLTVIWHIWASELARRHRLRPFVIVELIASIDPLDARRVAVLCAGLDLWARTRRDVDRPAREVSTVRPTS